MDIIVYVVLSSIIMLTFGLLLLREQKLKWRARDEALRYRIALRIILYHKPGTSIEAVAKQALGEDK